MYTADGQRVPARGQHGQHWFGHLRQRRIRASSRPAPTPAGIAAGGGGGPSTLLLRPGVYYVGGGGLKLKSGSARVFAIPSACVMSDAQAKTTFATNLSDTAVVTPGRRPAR